MRVWVCRCEALSNNTYRDDVLILAGDISDDQSVLRNTFEIVVQKFKDVFFVPGNHDLWVRRKERDLLDSLGELLPCQVEDSATGVDGVLMHPKARRTWFPADEAASQLLLASGLAE